jgi:hypothetical protein
MQQSPDCCSDLGMCEQAGQHSEMVLILFLFVPARSFGSTFDHNPAQNPRYAKPILRQTPFALRC